MDKYLTKNTKRKKDENDSDVEEEEPPKKVAKKEVVKDDKTDAKKDEKLSPDEMKRRIVQILQDMGKVEKNNGEIYKAKAYRVAAENISKSDQPVTSGAQAMKLKGVGKKIGLKIDEIIQSGKLNKLDNAMADDNTVAVMELTRVYGIGPKFAKKLVDENKIMSVNDLQEAHKKKKVKLNHQQELGLKYFKEMEMKIPRAEVATYEELIFEKIRELDSTIIMTLCGSYRRGLEKSGDIDLLITQPKSSSKATEKYTTLKRVVDKLTKDKIITDSIAHGDTKFSGLVILPDSIEEFTPHIPRRMDIRFVTHDQYYCALLYFTGSDYFNNQMRLKAIEEGYHINEYAITKVESKDKPLKVTCEEDIFKYIDMDYRKPEDRNA